MLEVKNISSGYGKKQVLYDVSLTVHPGEVVLLTGGNGPFRTFTLRKEPVLPGKKWKSRSCICR